MAASLTRNQLGRLAAHARNAQAISGVTTAFSASDWAGFSGTGTATPSVSSDSTPGELVVTLNSGSGQRGVRYTAVEPGVDCFVVAERRQQTTGGGPGVVARQKSASPADDFVAANGPFGFAGNWNLYERASAATVQQDPTSANRSTAAVSRHALWTRSTLANAFQESPTGSGPATISQALTGLAAGTNGTFAGVYFGSAAANASRWQSFALMRSAILRVEGPPTGSWVVRLRNAGGTVIYTSSAHSSGVVEINTLTELGTLYAGAVPLMAQIEIYDTGTASVLVSAVSPSEYLWGGDVWTYLAVPATPDAPVVDDVTETTVALSWDAVFSADSYKVFRSTGEGEFGTYTEIDEVTDPEFIDTGLTPGVLYWYRIQACNAAGCSAQSSATSATTIPVGFGPGPELLRASGIGPTTVRTRWTGEILEALGYRLRRSTAEEGPFTLVYEGTDNTFTDTGRDPETTYWYTVVALVLDDEEEVVETEPTGPVSATTFPTELPPAEPEDILRRTGPTGRWRRREPWETEFFPQVLATEGGEFLVTEDDVFLTTET
jgi:hypothetical protein